MTEFSIDGRLLNDCHVLVQTEELSFLLHSNAEVAWFIIVPHTGQTEFYQLDSKLQSRLCEQVNLLSKFIKLQFNSDKINVATIGNVVSQTHIHVIGRRLDDAYWPDVVWGRKYKKSYGSEEVSLIKQQLISSLNLEKSVECEKDV